MKKIIILIVISLFISGCIPDLSGIKMPGLPGKKTVGGKKAFSGGTLGIESEILRPIEGEKVHSSQPLEIVVKLSNKGETDSEGVTCISGLNKKYFTDFSGCDCQESEPLEGKKKVGGETQEGEEERLIFDIGAIQPVEKATITAKTRYKYITYGIITACIKKDAYSEEGCEILGKNMITSASSAPLGIVEVTEDIRATDDTAKMTFNIKLKETGKNGDLYGLDEDMDQCETPKDLKQNIKVELINAPGSSSCGSVELDKEGEATAQCTVDNVKVFTESYETPITLKLEYAYETIDSNIFEVV